MMNLEQVLNELLAIAEAISQAMRFTAAQDPRMNSLNAMAGRIDAGVVRIRAEMAKGPVAGPATHEENHG